MFLYLLRVTRFQDVHFFFFKNVIFSTKAYKEREITTYKITTMFLIFHESKPLRSYTRGSYKKKKVYGRG